MNNKVNTFLNYAVVVATLDEARAAADVAQRHNASLTLLTEPGACARLGPGYLLEMVRQAGAGDNAISAVIDCGADAGYAMLALRLGWKEIHVAGKPDVVRRIAQMTHTAGGLFHAEMPVALPQRPGMAVDQSLEEVLLRHASD